MPPAVPVLSAIGGALGATGTAAAVVGGAVVAGTVATGVSLAKTAAAGRALPFSSDLERSSFVGPPKGGFWLTATFDVKSNHIPTPSSPTLSEVSSK